MKTEILNACDQAVASTANGVYQGIILTALVALTVRWLGRTNAATRHSIWMTTLWILPGLIAAHLWLDPLRMRRQPMPSGSEERSPATEAENRTEDASRIFRSSPPSDFLIIPLPKPDPESEAQSEIMPEDQKVQATAAAPPVPWERMDQPVARLPPATRGAPEAALYHPPSGEREATRPAPAAGFSRLQVQARSVVKRLAEPIYWNPASGFALPRVAALAVLATWLIIASWRLALLACRIFQLRKLKRESFPPAEALHQLFCHLRRRLGLRREVELRVSKAHHSPVVVGFLHPVVLLPPGEVLSTDSKETEHILRHELAHVARADDWANLLQHFLQATLFFHPGVWWISRRLALEREVACDDQVLQQLGCPRSYALVLANVASRLKRCPLRLAPGVSTNKSQLQQRINMILDTKRNRSPFPAKTRVGFVTSAAALVAVLAIYSGPRLVLAETSATAAPTALPAPEAGNQAVAEATATGLALAAPEAGALAVAQNEDPTPPVAIERDSGPRYKSSGVGGAAPQAVIISPAATPAPSVAGVPPVPATPSVIVAVPRPAALPPGPGAPSFAYVAAGQAGNDDAIEERLARLERLVQSLMAQQRGMHPGPGQPMMKLGPPPNFKMNEKQLAEIKEMAERDAARGQEEAKHAMEQARHAAKDREKAMKEKGRWERGMQKDSLEKQLEGLRRAKEGLERQMERLDSQIERLQQDQEKRQEDQEQRSELQENQEQEETAVAEVETE